MSHFKTTRTDVINHLYDMLDHEYEAWLTLEAQKEDAYFGMDGKKKKKCYE